MPVANRSASDVARITRAGLLALCGACVSSHGYADAPIPRDAAIEARVRDIVAGMTLAQKIGQMTQAEIKSATPDDVRRYFLGAIVNGGGSWPGGNKHASVADWVALADRYYDASMATGLEVPIPVAWGTDAVHGHNNVYGATIFPHNIGLGAAHDAALVGRIAAATARAVRATGIDWMFAPAVPVAQNIRWGRTYESWSEDPALVRTYAASFTHGAQGRFADDANAIATAKHFIGDGGTTDGQDQGVTRAGARELLRLHGAGYQGAIGAGVQAIMASYSSWVDVARHVDHGRMHGNAALIGGTLKSTMGFDGLVVSDWNAIGQLPGCTDADCAAAVNAGVDLFMVPDDWQAFIAHTIAAVESGRIPQARIDDAVRRIVRVKLRAGLFDGRRPSMNRYAGRSDAVEDRALAREAVRASLVLLKNERAALPLARGARVLVVGKSADSVPNQTGGWSLTWQGTGNTNADFPHADSLLAGIRAIAGAGHVTYSAGGDGVDVARFDAVIAVIGETPYAETNGDFVPSATLRHTERHPEDLAVLRTVSGKGPPVVTVFVSGRPLYVNDLLNLSDAFVAAWLPGTEGAGVGDVLFAGADGRPAHDFRGRLPFGWPRIACPRSRAFGPNGEPPLFARGYGLTYAHGSHVPRLPVDATRQCGKATELSILPGADSSIEWPAPSPALRVRTVPASAAEGAGEGAVEVTWHGPAKFFARSVPRRNLVAFARARAALRFDVTLATAPTRPVFLEMQCGPACGGTLDLTSILAPLPPGGTRTVTIPLACLAARGAELEGIDVPFMITADAPFAAAFARVRIVAGAAGEAMDCGNL